MMNNNPFETLGLNKRMVEVTEKLYFNEPTSIQRKTIPLILDGKSVVGQSQTGSGKTHAFLLPLLNNIDEMKDHVQLVITAPTRELAIQLFEEVKTIRQLANKDDDWHARLIIGGLDRERMMRQLQSRTPHIIVGTPGRILDMVDADALSIYHAKSFVIDEADLMLDLKFIEKIDALLVRSNESVQILVFSATIPKQLDHFIRKFLRQPEKIQIDHAMTPENLTHRLIELKHGENIGDKLLEITKLIQPYVAIVFTNSKEKADEIGKLLANEGFNVGLLHGDLSSRERMRIVRGINDLQYEYIVATDLASRGIDIKGASHVINVELPKEREFYIHRVGRTARAGGSGLAISFFNENDHRLISDLEKERIPFIYCTIQNNEWVETKHFDRKQVRKKTNSDLDREAWKMVRKPKKVKPGYRKKMKQEKEKIKKQLVKEKHRKTGRRNK